jgi:hypothetical protein
VRLTPTSDRQVASDIPAPGIAPAPRRTTLPPKRKVVVTTDDSTPQPK